MEDMDRTFDESIIYSLAYYYKDRWDERVSEPIYYGDYVKQYLVPGQASDKAIKAERYKKPLHSPFSIRAHGTTVSASEMSGRVRARIAA